MRISLIYPMITDFKQMDNAFGSLIRSYCSQMKKSVQVFQNKRQKPSLICFTFIDAYMIEFQKKNAFNTVNYLQSREKQVLLQSI